MKNIQKTLFSFALSILFTVLGFSQECAAPRPYIISETPTSATIGWDRLNERETYKIELYSNSNRQLIQSYENVRVNQFQFNNLQSGKNYKALVYRICSQGSSVAGGIDIDKATVIADDPLLRPCDSTTNNWCTAECSAKPNSQYCKVGSMKQFSISAGTALRINISNKSIILNFMYAPIEDKIYVNKQAPATINFNITTVNNNSTVDVTESTSGAPILLFSITNLNRNRFILPPSITFDMTFYDDLQLSTCTFPDGTGLGDVDIQQRAAQKSTELEALELSISPNPVTDAAMLNFTLPEASVINTQIYNLQGQMIQSLNLGHYPSGENQAEINTDALPKGIYFLTFMTSKDKIIKKIVKQ